MTEATAERRQAVKAALAQVGSSALAPGALALFQALGYRSDKVADFPSAPEAFIAALEQATPDKSALVRDQLALARWKECAFLYQITNDEIPSLGHFASLAGGGLLQDSYIGNQIESFVFLAIELQGENWSRTELAAITRALNQRFPMPAIVLFKHDGLMSLAIVDRRAHKRDASRDVLSARITVIKDVRCDNPHRAHVDILAGLAIENLGERQRPTNFRELYDAWISALSIQELNKRFYRDLAWWYLWAKGNVQFPKGGGKDEETRHSIAVIRLLTRLIFIWFIKERGLVPESLFDQKALAKLLKQDPTAKPEDNVYYHAILQNLFFATLNVEMGDERKWASDKAGQKSDYLISRLYRHKEAFRDADAALKVFQAIPFLNGGLFECLDRDLTDKDFQRNPELKELAVKEGTGWVLRVDGFSRRAEAQAQVPNKLFFDGTPDANLNKEFETKGKKYPVKGLLEIFGAYKFTVDENTPLDEEVALDPELLGKVFENLLASYNEDTKTTARKQSGSFYTPREVVDYMVDEALVAYFQRHLLPSPPGKGIEGEGEAADTITATRLRRLLSLGDNGHDFNAAETKTLIRAVEQLKVLDPACGSGAFPMGALQKLFRLLRKLDPDNRLWAAQNRQPYVDRVDGARRIASPSQREEEVSQAEAALEKFDREMADPAYADYTRKLYLIEKCIYGVDIQPIAVQIAKLRFFIALIVSQPIRPQQDNCGITALPNLETKIVAANTLFTIPRHGRQASLLDDPEIAKKEEALRQANAAYFAAPNFRRKKERKAKVYQLHDELCDLLQKGGLVKPDDAERMARFDPFDQNRNADFFDVEWMFALHRAKDGSEGVFDAVIGNPPYVRQEEIKHLKPRLKAEYECATGTADLYVYFYERSVKLLAPGGVISFITSNKWYRAKYGEGLRLFLRNHTRILNLIDFGDAPVFTAIAYPTILIAGRRAEPLMHPPASDSMRVMNWNPADAVETFSSLFAEQSFPLEQSTLTKEGWQLEPPLKRRLLERIRAAAIPLEKWCNGQLYYGIKTGFNEAFVINGPTRAALIQKEPKAAQIIKPLLRGRDVKRWKVEPEDYWLIFIPWHFPLQEGTSISGASLEAEKAFKAGYPAVYEHLHKYKGKLSARDKAETGIRYEWYALARYREYWREFEKTKIVFPAIQNGVSYAPDLAGYFGNDKTNIIVTEDWQYLLGVLNSSFSWWLTQQTFSGKQGGFFEFKPMYVSRLPIPNADLKQKKMIESAVVAVLATVEVPRFEQLINAFVYELFFPKELHVRKLHFFDEAAKAGLSELAGLKGKALAEAAGELAERIFAPSHPLYAMLFDLQAVDEVRIIEGKE